MKMKLLFMIVIAYGSLVMGVDAMFKQERSRNVSNQQLVPSENAEKQIEESLQQKALLESDDQLREQCRFLRDAMHGFSSVRRHFVRGVHALMLYQWLQCSRFEKHKIQ